ncbi:MAG: acetolactate synthase small subunit [Akkermansiaceae bacterium]|nr:acetolactate synthase small subunit [Akkermansiaceae bacterium]
MTKKKLVTTDTPEEPTRNEVLHTLSVYVNNTAGVLMRICQVFARRAFNIESLVVSQGRDSRFSRMTIGIVGNPIGFVQIIKQVNKLIDVIHCFEHSAENSVVKEMLLIKFMAETASQRTDALQIVEHFGGKTVDLTPNSMVAMVTGDTPKVDAAISMLGQFDIIETVRTGKVVMARGEQPT